MEFKCHRAEIKDVENATVLMQSGDHLSVGYIDPRGKFHTINISAQHLVFLATHEQSEAAMIIRPSVGVQFVPGVK